MAADSTIINRMNRLTQDGNTLNRVKYAMQKAALDVMAEAATVPSHSQRVTYAKTILAGTASVYETTVAVLTNATIGAAINLAIEPHFNIDENDIQFVVNAVFNAFAGVAL